MHTIEQVLYLSMVTASISFTLAESRLFLPFREWVEGRNATVGHLLACGYCLGHWVAFALVAVFRPRLFEGWWLLAYFLTALVIAWLAALQWALLCVLTKIAGK